MSKRKNNPGRDIAATPRGQPARIRAEHFETPAPKQGPWRGERAAECWEAVFGLAGPPRGQLSPGYVNKGKLVCTRAPFSENVFLSSLLPPCSVELAHTVAVFASDLMLLGQGAYGER